MAAASGSLHVGCLSVRSVFSAVRQFHVDNTAFRYKNALIRRLERKKRTKFYIPEKKSTKSGKPAESFMTR